MRVSALRFCAAAFLCFAVAGCGGSDEQGLGSDASFFTYSLLTSSESDSEAMLDELRTVAFPVLNDAGAQVYATFGDYVPTEEDAPLEPSAELAANQLALLLRWREPAEGQPDTKLASLTSVATVQTSFLRIRARFEEERLEADEGFYIHRWTRYPREDVEEVVSLSEEIWALTEEPVGSRALGLLEDAESSDGEVRLLTIVRYDDIDHWWEARGARDREGNPVPGAEALIDQRNALANGPSEERTARLIEP